MRSADSRDHPTAALEQLPGRPGHDPFERLAAAFLLGYTSSTARAYRTDLTAWHAHAPGCSPATSTTRNRRKRADRRDFPRIG